MPPKKILDLTPNTPFRSTLGTIIFVIVVIAGVFVSYADNSKDIASIEIRIEKIEDANGKNREDIQKIKIDIAEIKSDMKYIIKGIDELKKRR